jgi:hypothetical protein
MGTLSFPVAPFCFSVLRDHFALGANGVFTPSDETRESQSELLALRRSCEN